MLVGIPKAPSNYSPLINMDAAKKRQLFVLNSLLNNNIITEEEKEKAYQEKLVFIKNDDIDRFNSIQYY